MGHRILSITGANQEIYPSTSRSPSQSRREPQASQGSQTSQAAAHVSRELRSPRGTPRLSLDTHTWGLLWTLPAYLHSPAPGMWIWHPPSLPLRPQCLSTLPASTTCCSTRPALFSRCLPARRPPCTSRTCHSHGLGENPLPGLAGARGGITKPLTGLPGAIRQPKPQPGHVVYRYAGS